MRPWHRRACPSVESSTAEETGLFGENAAASFLQGRGYRVLVRRYRIKAGEIDLVCRHGEVLVFVEVKTRSGTDFGRPAEAVTPEKQRRISRAALGYLRLLGNPPIIFRFDIVEVFLVAGEHPRFEIIPGAFELAEPYIY